MTTVIGASIQIGLVLLLGPLFEGLMRTLVRARIHSRQGPPILQPFYDIFKLLIKADVQPTTSWIYALPPVFCMATILTASLLVPVFGQAVLGDYGDAILFIYLMTASVVAIVLAGAMSASTYAFLGLAREIMMMLTVEPVLIIWLVTAALSAGSLNLSDMAAWNLEHGPSVSMIIAGLAVLLAIQAQVGKLPFDIAEADQEIMGGPFIELSGPKLAMFEWALWAKQFVFVAMLVQIFAPWPDVAAALAGSVALGYAVSALLLLAKVLVVVALVALIDAVNPRLRIEQAMFYFVSIIFLAAIGLAFAIVGI